MIREVSRALYGVWRFLRLDSNAASFFENSLAAARRSFVVAAIVAPLFAIQAFIDFGDKSWVNPGVSPGIYAIVQVEFYVILWTAWPVFMASLAPLLGCTERYGAYIAASNWFALVEFVFLLPLTAIEGLSILPDPVVLEIRQSAQIVLLLYEWFIARSTLKVSSAIAAALVVIELLLIELVAVIAHGQLSP